MGVLSGEKINSVNACDVAFILLAMTSAEGGFSDVPPLPSYEETFANVMSKMEEIIQQKGLEFAFDLLLDLGRISGIDLTELELEWEKKKRQRAEEQLVDERKRNAELENKIEMMEKKLEMIASIATENGEETEC